MITYLIAIISFRAYKFLLAVGVPHVHNPWFNSNILLPLSFSTSLLTLKFV